MKLELNGEEADFLYDLLIAEKESLAELISEPEFANLGNFEQELRVCLNIMEKLRNATA